jgi:hypothetical protein
VYTPPDVPNWNNAADASIFMIFERGYLVEKVMSIRIMCER